MAFAYAAPRLFRVTLKTKTQTACIILVVADDTTTRVALVSLLGHLGYQTIQAATVIEALANLDGLDCAILDLNLPDGLGTTILERIRTEDRPIWVAIASGASDPSVLAEAEPHRPDVVLRKPIDVRALLEWLDDAG